MLCFGDPGYRGRVSGFPSLSCCSYEMVMHGLVLSLPSPPPHPHPQFSEFGDWVVHLSFVRSFLVSSCRLAAWLIGEWGWHSRPQYQSPYSPVPFSSPGCAEGWKFSLFPDPQTILLSLQPPSQQLSPALITHSHKWICGFERRD